MWILSFLFGKASTEKVYIHNNEWRLIREKVLIRDNYKCNTCKKYFYKNKSKLHVHHIIERSQWGEDNMDNLTLLCINCHSKHHENSDKPIHSSVKKRIIENAIENNKNLHFDYRAESLWWIWTNSTRIVKPEKFYSHNWHYYMYGFCHLDNDFRYFRVSRIIRFHQE